MVMDACTVLHWKWQEVISVERHSPHSSDAESA